jgi:hypothetical protein
MMKQQLHNSLTGSVRMRMCSHTLVYLDEGYLLSYHQQVSDHQRGRRKWHHPESGEFHQVKDTFSFHQGEDLPDTDGNGDDYTGRIGATGEFGESCEKEEGFGDREYSGVNGVCCSDPEEDMCQQDTQEQNLAFVC